MDSLFTLICILFFICLFIFANKSTISSKITNNDEYLDYLHNKTTRKFKKLSDNEYLCEVLSLYIRIEDNKAICTRQSYYLGIQTMNGPFCNWFTVNKYNMHLYIH